MSAKTSPEDRVVRIDCPASRIEENTRNRQRFDACQSFRRPDRVPVQFSISNRYVFDARGVSPEDYYDNPHTQMEEQLLNHKWHLEHVVDDRIIDTRTVGVTPDSSTIRGGYFDVELKRFADTTICAAPILHRPEDIDALEVPDVDNGYYGRMVQWFHRMKEMAQDYDVRLNGEPVAIRVTISAGGGPIPDAYALAGQNLFLWMIEGMR